MYELMYKPYFNRRNYILTEMESLDLSVHEAFLLLYLDYCNEFHIGFDLEQVAKQFKMTALELDTLMNQLMNRGYLEIRMRERRVEYVLDGVFRMKDNLDTITTNEFRGLFDLFEEEFARPLTPRESERLSEWMSTYELKLIEFALREAVVYEKRSIDYIEAILLHWKEKQLTVAQYEEGMR